MSLKYLIQFMMNTFIRPTDLKYLKHRNIVIEKIFDDAQKRDCLAIYYEHGKTKTHFALQPSEPFGIYSCRLVVTNGNKLLLFVIKCLTLIVKFLMGIGF